MDTAPEALTELVLLVRTIAHVHHNLLAKQDIAVPALAKTSFEVLALASELQSDALNIATAYRRRATDFLQQVESIRTQRAETANDLGTLLWRLLILSYIALMGAIFEAEEFGLGNESDDNIRKLNQQIREIIVEIPLEKTLTELVIPDNASLERVATLMFIRACAARSIFGDKNLYMNVLSLCNFQADFLEAYFAASIIKLDRVAVLVDYSSLSDEQYACLSMLDIFYFLPGVRSG